MRVVHISTVHKVSDIRIFHKECMALSDAGHNVYLIASADNENKLVQSNITLIELRPVKGRIRRLIWSQWLALRKALYLRADAYHFHDPELIFLGMFLRLIGKRVIYDVHEDLPLQLHSKYWIPSILKPILEYGVRYLEAIGGLMMTGVIAVTPDIEKRFPSHKTILVRNFPKISEWRPDTEAEYNSRQNRVIYCGSISKQQGVMQLLETARILKVDYGVEVVMAGRFDSYGLEQEFENKGGKEIIRYLGWLNRPEVVKEMSKSRIGIVIDHPIPNYLTGYSTKLFEYMAAGLPSVVSRIPFWVSMFEHTRGCIFVDPYNPKEIAEVIKKLIYEPTLAYNMGLAARKAIENEFNWELDAIKLVSSYKNLETGKAFK